VGQQHHEVAVDSLGDALGDLAGLAGGEGRPPAISRSALIADVVTDARKNRDLQCGRSVTVASNGGIRTHHRTAPVITVGSVSRDTAAETFAFLAPRFRGRRNAIKELTHAQPDFVFWIYPDGRLYDARNAHAHNVPRGYEYILNDEPDYGGFLRGRIMTFRERQLVVVYCRPTALAAPGPPVTQLVRGLGALPVPLAMDALVISDNADLYGTFADLINRHAGQA
jgi:hypothetical protein